MIDYPRMSSLSNTGTRHTWFVKVCFSLFTVSLPLLHPLPVHSFYLAGGQSASFAFSIVFGNNCHSVIQSFQSFRVFRQHQEKKNAPSHPANPPPRPPLGLHCAVHMFACRRRGPSREHPKIPRCSASGNILSCTDRWWDFHNTEDDYSVYHYNGNARYHSHRDTNADRERDHQNRHRDRYIGRSH